MKLLFFQYCEMLCLGISLMLIPRIRKTHFLLFVPYLLVVVFTDVISNYIKAFYINHSNQWLFNLFLPFQHVFFSLMFKNTFESILLKKIIDISLGIFFIIYFTNLFWGQGFWEFNNYTFLYTAVLMILYSGLYLLLLVRKENYANFLSDPTFWISSASLIFFTGFTVFFSVFFYYKDSSKNYNEHLSIYLFIRKYIITLHYLLLSISLLTIRKSQNV